MSRRTRHSGRAINHPAGGRVTPAQHLAVQVPLDERLRPWLLAGVMGLYVARTFMPSDTTVAESGSGMPFVMLWLLLALWWGLGAFVGRRHEWRCGWADLAATSLVVSVAISSLLALRTEAPRPTLNMLWEWIGLGLGYFLLRQLLRTAREMRAVLAVMLAMAVGHTCYAFYQYHISIPATKAEYLRDPEAGIRAAGIQAPPGSAEREQFEDRLLYSSEPFSTFTLTNSLAGFLAPWLVVGAGILASGWNNVLWNRLKQCLFGLALALVAGGLYLTKSRSGCLAAGCGTALLLAAALYCKLNARFRTQLKIGFLVVAMAVVAVVTLGAGQSQALAGARLSLSYRFEYWQATAHMIADHPLWGVGAGNFGDWYPTYKLPQALEEIKDPHNFLFEVWASSGVLSVVALLMFLFLVILTAFHTADTTASGSRAIKPFLARLTGRLFGLSDGGSKPAVTNPDAARLIQWGGLAGLLLAPGISLTGVDGPEPAALACAAPASVVVMWLIDDWVRAGYASPWVAVAGLVTLLVNLLAAGGIAFPAVAGTMWILAALAVTQAESFRPPQSAPRAGIAGAVFGLVGLALACQQTGIGPVLTAHRAVADAEGAMTQGNATQARSLLESAAAADRWSPLPWRYLAQLAIGPGPGGRVSRDWTEFERAADRYLRLSPHSNMAWLETGLMCLEASHRAGNQEYAQQAVRYLRRAVELYPTSAVRRAHLALALRAAGDDSAANDEAATAIRLHENTPHTKKQLPSELLQQLRRTPK